MSIAKPSKNIGNSMLHTLFCYGHSQLRIHISIKLQSAYFFNMHSGNGIEKLKKSNITDKLFYIYVMPFFGKIKCFSCSFTLCPSVFIYILPLRNHPQGVRTRGAMVSVTFGPSTFLVSVSSAEPRSSCLVSVTGGAAVLGVVSESPRRVMLTR
jgi:hypothetical protein